MKIPVIDLFAGPGGLSEGFSRYREFSGDTVGYSVKLSIEKEEPATRTLRLRAFFRQFEQGKVPEEYYSYLRSSQPVERAERLRELRKFKEWRSAAGEVWKKALGDGGDMEFFKLHRRIKRRVADADCWVLLGGPPCQAYSTVGRARRLGDGRDLRQDLTDDELEQRRRDRAASFFQDKKHTLYKEYLEIVALHQPAVFVMENVKGILSSKIPAEDGGQGATLIFDRIIQDLKDPWGAVRRADLPEGWEQVADGRAHGYELYSFTTSPNQITGDCLPEDYLIHSERYGVPQERHRVILLGVREDLDEVPRPLHAQLSRVSVKQVIGNMPRLRSGRSGRGTVAARAKRSDSFEHWVEAVKRSIPSRALKQIDPKVRETIEHCMERISGTRLERGGSFIPTRQPRQEPSSDLDRWLRDDRLGGVIQHETRDHMDADFGRYLFAAAYGRVTKQSPKIRHFPMSLLPHHENVRDASGKPTGSKVFHDRFRVQLANKPSTTIMAHIRKDGHYYIHYDPSQCRSLTVREAARLQTFPDNYFFEGNRTEQYEQVGNAVPPYLAVQLAGVVAGVLQQVHQMKTTRSKRNKEKTMLTV